mgnify:CR=1 FL=1
MSQLAEHLADLWEIEEPHRQKGIKLLQKIYGNILTKPDDLKVWVFTGYDLINVAQERRYFRDHNRDVVFVRRPFRNCFRKFSGRPRIL